MTRGKDRDPPCQCVRIPVYRPMTVPEEGFCAMLLTCPNCGTQYVVKDGAIPPQGRQVRCASCKHSWHQDPEQVEAGDEAPFTEQVAPVEQAEVPTEPEDETLAEATMIEPRSGPEAEQRAYEAAIVADEAPAEAQGSAEPAPAARSSSCRRSGRCGS